MRLAFSACLFGITLIAVAGNLAAQDQGAAELTACS